MKLLTVSALLCVMVALSTAADGGGSDREKGLSKQEKVDVEKRAVYYWHRRVGWIRLGNRYYYYNPYRRRWIWIRWARRYWRRRGRWIRYGGRYYYVFPYRRNMARAQETNV